MTNPDQERLLRQEVQELTEMLRTDRILESLRNALASEGLSYNEVLLAGFLESENWNEWGAIVTKEGKVFRYERDTRPEAAAEFRVFNRVKNIERYIRDWHPAVQVALQMVAE